MTEIKASSRRGGGFFLVCVLSAQRLIFAKLQLSKVRYKIRFISRSFANRKYQFRTVEERQFHYYYHKKIPFYVNFTGKI